MKLIDVGLVLYCALFGLFLWRILCYWNRACCGKWLEYANYCTILLLLLFGIFSYQVYNFFYVVMSDEGEKVWATMPGWIKPCMIIAPFISLATYIACATQTFQHVELIREEASVDRHDKAVQIICLPAVYTVMCFSAVTTVYTYLGTEPHPYSEENAKTYHLILARGEVCFWVADLYESWALYQFGVLTLDVIKSNMKFQSQCGRDERERAAALALLGATPAVENLVWLGILSFVICCVMEAGWAIFLLNFNSHLTAQQFDESMSQFTMAGFIASCAAIFNVLVVETSFHPFLESFHPIWKFFTVKILVTFAWVQKCAFKFLHSSNGYLPPHIRNFIDGIPILGTIMTMPRSEFELFYGFLLINECFMIACCHFWAWNASEEWYDKADGADDEEPNSVEAPKDWGSLLNSGANVGQANYGAFHRTPLHEKAQSRSESPAPR